MFKFRSFDEKNKIMYPVVKIDFLNNLVEGYLNNQIYLFDLTNLMLYTGLFDKNKKEICENDIVIKYYNESFKDIKYKVIFNFGKFFLECIDERIYPVPNESLNEDCFIISNIYEFNLSKL